MQKKIFICSTTKLCEINHHHTTEVRDFFLKNGYEVVSDPNTASDIVVMTCGALQISEDRSVEMIERLGAGTTDKSFYVMGCLPSIQPDLPILRNIRVIGARDMAALEEAFPATVPIGKIDTHRIDYDFLDVTDGNPNRYTIVVVQGCLGSCTYCAIHKAKGWAKSMPLLEVTRHFESILRKNSNASVALLGEDFGSYGSDIETDPVELLLRLTRYEGAYSIEIQNFEPSIFLHYYQRLREIFLLNRIVKIHIAIQTGSQDVLRRMGRDYDIAAVVQAIEDSCTLSPRLVLETSFIINFPGETHSDFLRTLELLPKFDEVTVYNFSPRRGTKAASMSDDISATDKQTKIGMVLQLQQVHPGLVFM